MKQLTLIIAAFILIQCSNTKQLGIEVTTPSGLRYTIIKKGKGEPASDGNEVAIYEKMAYPGGKVMFMIERPAKPIRFTLGAHQVLEGIEEGMTGMRAGEIRKLIVPPSLSKRREYPPGLSPDSILIYHIELVEIIKK